MQKRRTSVLSDQRNMTRYLAVLLFFLFLLAVSYFHFMLDVFNAKDLKLFGTTNFLQILSGIGLTGLLISPFFFPDILYGLPRYPRISQAEGPRMQIRDIDRVGVEKYSLAFETGYLEFIRGKSDSTMMELKPYLQRDCNLASFAKITQIPAHHLAYYFRKQKKQSFTDYRNGYRVSHAKELMKEGKSREMTLEAIGMLSGFASRKTFLNVFKKVEKISPSIFLQQHLK